MGRDVSAMTISRQDRRAYREKVRACLDVLARMLRESRFDVGSDQVGLEMEFNLVDSVGNAAMSNAEVLAAIAEPAWANELGKFNIELSVEPASLVGEVFTSLESSIRSILSRASKHAEATGNRLVMVGILPSLLEGDIGEHAKSPNPRFKLLNDQMLAARGEEMRISIED